MDAASFVKSVHASLRQRLHEGDGDYINVWQNHCKQDDLLQKYAAAMHQLAIENWQLSEDAQKGNRINWCKNIIFEFYFNCGLENILSKDARRLYHQNLESGKEIKISNKEVFVSDLINKQMETMRKSFTKGNKIKLLDVGSCYDPFTEFSDIFETTAVDLYPATKSVIQCDFLNVVIKDAQLSEETDSEPPVELLKLNQLEAEYYHVVVFCLLLSYFPSPFQRWKCCIHAHQLLTDNGLLLIITPDSSHQNRNSKMVKSWKEAIESIGFTRCKYAKLDHLHCMAFRKSCNVTKDNAKEFAPSMYIPQDFNFIKVQKSDLDNDCSHNTENDQGSVSNNLDMNELPFAV